ncbi:MAG: type II toxin-antitoxin system VapB family antitoxin [Terriglobales bacterium]
MAIRSRTFYGKFLDRRCKERTANGGALTRTTIDIDDALMRKAKRFSGLTTKKAIVEAALVLFVQTRSQVGMRRFRGKIKWEGSLEESRSGRFSVPSSKEISKTSPLDGKRAELEAPTADLVAIVRKGRERIGGA